MLVMVVMPCGQAYPGEEASPKRNAAGKQFEVHFYPGLYKIAIYKKM